MSSSSAAPILRLRPYKHHAAQNQHDNVDSLPPSTLHIKSTTFLGPVKSQTTHVVRDLGFPGRLGEYVLLTYGDTLYIEENGTADHDSSHDWRGMVCNSVALATEDVTQVCDPRKSDSGGSTDERWWPDCFLKPGEGEDESEWALRLTGVIELSPGRGKHSSIFPAPDVLYFRSSQQ